MRIPNGGKPSKAGRRPDAFDEWLDRTLRKIFTPHPGQPTPPEAKALIELDQRQVGKPKPKPKRKTKPKAG